MTGLTWLPSVTSKRASQIVAAHRGCRAATRPPSRMRVPGATCFSTHVGRRIEEDDRVLQRAQHQRRRRAPSTPRLDADQGEASLLAGHLSPSSAFQSRALSTSSSSRRSLSASLPERARARRGAATARLVAARPAPYRRAPAAASLRRRSRPSSAARRAARPCRDHLAALLAASISRPPPCRPALGPRAATRLPRIDARQRLAHEFRPRARRAARAPAARARSRPPRRCVPSCSAGEAEEIARLGVARHRAPARARMPPWPRR